MADDTNPKKPFANTDEFYHKLGLFLFCVEQDGPRHRLRSLESFGTGASRTSSRANRADELRSQV